MNIADALGEEEKAVTPEHSPSPWKENGGSIYYDKLKNESFVVVLDANGQPVAKVLWSLPSGPHNVQLIVKAPENDAEVARLKAKVDDLRALLWKAMRARKKEAKP